VKTNFNKLKLEIDSVEQNLVSKIDKIKSLLGSVENEVNSLTGEMDQTNLKIEEMKVKNTASKTELDTLTAEKLELERDLSEKTNLYNSNETSISSLKDTKKDLDTKIYNETSKNEGFRKEIFNFEKEINELKQSLVDAEGLYQEKVKSIEDNIESYRQKESLEKDQYKILKVLFDEVYIKSLYYDVCKVLNQPGMNKIDRLIQASGVSKETVEKVLDDLDTKQIILYNTTEGEFSVLKDFTM
jgi:chromosome segregation ATPase